MAEIIDSGGGGGKGKHQKKRAKKHSARIDMTPMVDLGFLLLTFFVLTSQFSKPKTMEISMPVVPKDSTHRVKVNEDNAMTLLLTENAEKIYYYYGKFKPDASIIKTTNYSKEGFRKVFRERNKDMIAKIKILKDKYAKNDLLILKLFNEKKSSKEIADSLKISTKTVLMRLSKYNLFYNKNKKDIDINLIHEYILSNLNYIEIAIILDVSTSVISKLYRNSIYYTEKRNKWMY